MSMPNWFPKSGDNHHNGKSESASMARSSETAQIRNDSHHQKIYF
jgi:hypothetical protein